MKFFEQMDLEQSDLVAWFDAGGDVPAVHETPTMYQSSASEYKCQSKADVPTMRARDDDESYDEVDEEYGFDVERMSPTTALGAYGLNYGRLTHQEKLLLNGIEARLAPGGRAANVTCASASPTGHPSTVDTKKLSRDILADEKRLDLSPVGLTTEILHRAFGIVPVKNIKGVYKNCRGIWAAQWTDNNGQRHTKYFNPKNYSSEEAARVAAFRFRMAVTATLQGLPGSVRGRARKFKKTKKRNDDKLYKVPRPDVTLYGEPTANGIDVQHGWITAQKELDTNGIPQNAIVELNTGQNSMESVMDCQWTQQGIVRDDTEVMMAQSNSKDIQSQRMNRAVYPCPEYALEDPYSNVQQPQNYSVCEAPQDYNQYAAPNYTEGDSNQVIQQYGTPEGVFIKAEEYGPSQVYNGEDYNIFTAGHSYITDITAVTSDSMANSNYTASSNGDYDKKEQPRTMDDIFSSATYQDYVTPSVTDANTNNEYIYDMGDMSEYYESGYYQPEV